MVLELTGVSKVYYDTRNGGGLVALRNIDLRVEKNEFLCIVGPSGCGKTTLLNMIAGFESPTRGEIRLNGQKVKGPSPERGMVFQEYSLFPWMNIIENVEFGMVSTSLTRKEKREKALRLLDLVGLSEFERSRPSDLSGGMKQKAAVARTLALDPDVLLMDEPFGSLDEETRKRLDLELLNIWREERKTVVFITHNLGEAVTLGDRILLMSTGPGMIDSEWKLDLPRPRRPGDPRVASLRKEIGERLASVYENIEPSEQEPERATVAQGGDRSRIDRLMSSLERGVRWMPWHIINGGDSDKQKTR